MKIKTKVSMTGTNERHFEQELCVKIPHNQRHKEEKPIMANARL